MNEFQSGIITHIVYTFAEKANITNQDEICRTINRLCSMSLNDSVDAILVSLNDLLVREMITQDDIFANVELILQLNPKDYTSTKDLIDRLNLIKGMNAEHPSMTLAENHQLVVEAFDRFNKLIQGRFDCYYTGGIMCYLATGHQLERFHDDLDLFINLQQLMSLKDLVDSSTDFTFVSNMDHKEVNGHEYKIVYKGTSMSIGLFLFERLSDNSIISKKYYYDSQDGNKQLFVDEHHFSKNYTDMAFSNLVRYYNGTSYRMMSLESIYNSKKNARPKDRYDAGVIKGHVNMTIDYMLDIERKNNFYENHKIVSHSLIYTIEQMLQEQNNDAVNFARKGM